MRKLLAFVLILIFLAPGCGKPPITEKDVPIIPRTSILGSSVGIPPKVDPNNGLRIAFTAPYNSVLNVYVWDLYMSDARPKPVTMSKRPITNFEWDYTGNILYSKDENGDENYHICRADIDNGTETDLTPGKGFKASLFKTSLNYPNEIVVTINDRDPKVFDIKKIDILTGKSDLIFKNDENFVDFLIDSSFNLCAGYKTLPDGSRELLKRNLGKWETMEKIGFEDSGSTYLLDFNRSDRYFYMVDSRNRNTSALFKIDLFGWKKELIAEDEKSDFSNCLVWYSTNDVAAVEFNYDRKKWKAVDPEIQPDLDYLENLLKANFKVTSMDHGDNFWIVASDADDKSPIFYLYNRYHREAKPLFSMRPELDKANLAKMHPEIIKSRDGLDLVCYLSLPPWMDDDNDGIPNQPLPMILDVHGGPALRDSWGFNSMHQFFANRGYAVLSVNFRGSMGFGKKFLNLGNGEWGGKMHNDLIDAVDWAIAQKVAIPAKVAIYGGSYGGYAALVGMTFTPDKFACGVDLVGISNLSSFLKSTPSYWKPFYEDQKKRVGGDPDTKVGKIFLDSRSPINFVDMIQKPLLIGHGANDPRVKVAESEQIVASMKKKGIPVIYCYYPDEGHGFSRWQNSQSFFAVVENFLAKNLGGRCEEITKDTLDGSTLEVKEGVDLINGLKELMDGSAVRKIR